MPGERSTVANAEEARSGRYGMIVDRNVEIPMRDGAILVANVYRPDADGRFPALTALGPYGKDVHISENFPQVYAYIQKNQRSTLENSSGRYLQHEMPDVECLVREGYVVVRADIRGTGKTPGFQDPNSPQEYQDGYDLVEWAARQSWSSGRVGMIGVSYHAVGQWMVAAQRPPHLACILPWHGTAEYYDCRTRQGGIFCDGFNAFWWERQRLNQHGNPRSPFKDMFTGERNTGPASFSDEGLEANRARYVDTLLSHPLLDEWYKSRIPAYENIEVPALVVANWNGVGLHLRGTVEGFTKIASKQKWLRIETGPYFTTAMLPENIDLQLRFLDHFLKDIDNGWDDEPRVRVCVRSADDKIARWIEDNAWPLSSTVWNRLYLDPSRQELSAQEVSAPASASFDSEGSGIAFRTPPLTEDLTFAGPIKLRLWVSSTSPDIDLFVTLRAYDPAGKEIAFYGSVDPRSPVSQGWLRVSHRKKDPAKSREWLPVHTHDEELWLSPGEIAPVDIPIWPASVSLPAGSRLELLVSGQDFVREQQEGGHAGIRPHLHQHPLDRPKEKFQGSYQIHTGPEQESYLLLPVIPAASERSS